MDYEKKNKEAIKKAREWYNDAQIGIGFKANLEKLFPELKESEDEKWIPKEIAKYLKEKGGFRSCWVAWLEKQGKNNMGISEATKQKLEDNLNKALEKETTESWNKFLDGQGEQKPAEWSEEDEYYRGIIMYCLNNEPVGVADKKNAAAWLKSLRPQFTWKPGGEHYEIEEFAKIVRGNLTGISKDVQELFEAKYLQLTGNKMYGGYKD